LRRTALTLASFTLTVGLGTPAWAWDGNNRNGDQPRRFHSASSDRPGEGRSHYDRPENASRDDGNRPERFRSGSDDPPGEGRSHYDREHHEDPAL
jgi:hypothetical protein